MHAVAVATTPPQAVHGHTGRESNGEIKVWHRRDWSRSTRTARRHQGGCRRIHTSETLTLWYNSTMPTPFTHLRLVAPLLADPPPGPAADLLPAEPGPFLLGSAAPDVRTVSPISRRETHFYSIPPDPTRMAISTMLAAWPSLADATAMSPGRAAFLAGYLAHLWFDEHWHNTLINPYFVERDDWGSKPARFDVYNVLLGYLDQRDRAALDDSVSRLLERVEPGNWIPFVPDNDLMAWRDLLIDQLRPGGDSRTAEIMARRAHLDPVEFQALIVDEGRMADKVFRHIPRTAVIQAYQEGLEGSAWVIGNYLYNWRRC